MDVSVEDEALAKYLHTCSWRLERSEHVDLVLCPLPIAAARWRSLTGVCSIGKVLEDRCDYVKENGRGVNMYHDPPLFMCLYKLQLCVKIVDEGVSGRSRKISGFWLFIISVSIRIILKSKISGYIYVQLQTFFIEHIFLGLTQRLCRNTLTNIGPRPDVHSLSSRASHLLLRLPVNEIAVHHPSQSPPIFIRLP